MGSNLQKLENERWNPHEIQPNTIKQQDFLKTLRDKNFSTVKVVRTSAKWKNITHWHYALVLGTDPEYLIQFGTGQLDHASVDLIPKPNDDAETVCDQFLTIDEADSLLSRAYQVMGSNRFSVLLRNSEHVTKYIYNGEWRSNLLWENPDISAIYNQLQADVANYREQIPYDIKLRNIQYQKITDTPLLQFDRRLQVKIALPRSGNNILIIGPSGTGKSTLINLLLGIHLLPVAIGPDSVTADTCFVQCSNNFRYLVCLIDTPGFDDSHKAPAEILKKITSRLLSETICIHQVWLVLQYNSRFSASNKTILEQFITWLEQKKKVRICKVILTIFGDEMQIQPDDPALKSWLDIFKNMLPGDLDFTIICLKNFQQSTITNVDYQNLMKPFTNWLNEVPICLDETDSVGCPIL